MPQSTTAALRKLQAAIHTPVFKWTEELHEAFVVSKALATKWVLLAAPFRYDFPVIIQTDSSKVAMGYIICHIHDGVRRVVALGSRRWPDVAQNYAPYDLEAKTVCRRFLFYSQG